MAYTTQQAIETLNGYLSINETDKEYIDDTKKRGFVLELSSGERIVIFVYPLVHKQDNTKNYFDNDDIRFNRLYVGRGAGKESACVRRRPAGRYIKDVRGI